MHLVEYEVLIFRGIIFMHLIDVDQMEENMRIIKLLFGNNFMLVFRPTKAYGAC